MANFQQDSSGAYLAIKGNPKTAVGDEEGNSTVDVSNGMIKARLLISEDKKYYGDDQTGSDSGAYYLRKEYDIQRTEAYNDCLVSDMLHFTSLIDLTGKNIGSNQSGIGLRFKGWGGDNDRKNKERMVKKVIMKRLRSLTYSWSSKDSLNEPTGLAEKAKPFFVSRDNDKELLLEKMNVIEILFTSNVPQPGKEIMEVIAGMVGIVSDETLCEMTAKLIGVPVQTELSRLKEENQSDTLSDEGTMKPKEEQAEFLASQSETEGD